jgi:ABC-type phosphate/phosphonate transport system substrate-binding protein
MEIKMKKVLFKLVLTACAMASLAAVAQTAPKSDSVVKTEINKSYVDQRSDLIKKFGVTNTISMGWYTGGVDLLEIRDLWNNYTVLSNYLSERLGRLVVLETDKSDREVSKDALNSMDIVYTSAVMGVELMKAGWKPVVGRTEEIQGVILTQANAKVDSPADLKKLKIYGVKGATVTYFTASSIIKNNVYKAEEITQAADNPRFKIVNTKQNQLIDLLKSKDIDGAIIRETLANNLMKANPGKYKIAFKADAAPGHIIFVSPNVREDMVNQIRDSFLALTPDNPSYKKILSGLDGYQETDKTPFKVVTAANVAVANGVLASTGEKPLDIKK